MAGLLQCGEQGAFGGADHHGDGSLGLSHVVLRSVLFLLAVTEAALSRLDHPQRQVRGPFSFRRLLAAEVLARCAG